MERKLTAILSADVKGYSRLMGEDEEGTLDTLTAYRQLIDSRARTHAAAFRQLRPSTTLMLEGRSEVVNAVNF
jgi:hypothetical protein